MKMIDFPEIHFPIQGLDQVRIPKMYRIRELYEDDHIQDIRSHLVRKMQEMVSDGTVWKGKNIAVTVGSRGIPGLSVMVRTICDTLKEWGALPFIIPAMGSHGGGTAEGNLEVLAGYGITPEAMQVPIKAGMDVVQIATLDDGADTPVYCDRFAAEADGILLFNKVKPHTD